MNHHPVPVLIPGEPAAAYCIHVQGQVQGVGFRPYIYRLAQTNNLAGVVQNDSRGVRIQVEGNPDKLREFFAAITSELPAGAAIEKIDRESIPVQGYSGFVIQQNAPGAIPEVRIPRDRSICLDCAKEITQASSRRRGYLFVTCTGCGPRFSVLLNLPYERCQTTMSAFQLCVACQKEYRDPASRYFHAESLSCAECGPQLQLWDRAGRCLATTAQALDAAVRAIQSGSILAVKGLGGFQLVCLATSDSAVRLLRERKKRPDKPFAVMVQDATTCSILAKTSACERTLLDSADNPIVLLEKDEFWLSNEIAPGLNTIGIFYPTTALHAELIRKVGVPVVVTSGNRGDEPIAVDEHQALTSLGECADLFLVHNRPIARRLDDSVIRIIDGLPVPIRSGRGLAPLKLPSLEREARQRRMPSILATGGHQKAALALWTGSQALLGPHIGDLDSPANRQAFHEAIRDVTNLYGCSPQVIAHDCHPDYYSSRWAENSTKSRVAVPHHVAHALSCMVEHDLLDRPVHALTWDGTGYGDDGTIWGGEILSIQGATYQRRASLMPFKLPGGESAIRQPNRLACSLLHEMGYQLSGSQAWLLRYLEITDTEYQLLAQMLRRQVQCPMTTSVGRLFDAAAALIARVLQVSYEGQAAQRLEGLVARDHREDYPLPRGDWRPLIRSIVQDIEAKVDPPLMSARFHNALITWGVTELLLLPGAELVLSGGCFFNKFLAEGLAHQLRTAGRKVYLHHNIPAGDGGLAAGQLAYTILFHDS